MRQSPSTCPLCDSPLSATGSVWALDTLLAMWDQVTFSQNTRQELAEQSSQTQLHVCEKCELEIFLPQIIGTSRFYEDLETNSESGYYAGEKWEFQEAIKDAPKAAKIIEIGCGTGTFLNRAQLSGLQVVGTEYNAAALLLSREKGFTVLGRNEDTAHLHGTFDAAFSFHVLEHVQDPVNFLKAVAAFVKPGGLIGISVPNKFGITKFIIPCVSEMPPHHATKWSAKSLQMAGKRAGLTPKRFAFEPLALSQAYYLNYWAENGFANTKFESLWRSAAKKLVPKAIKRMKQLRLTYVPGFRGMSVYSLFQKPV